MSKEIKYKDISWALMEGYPWWPVYICNPSELRNDCHFLGSGHKQIQNKAKRFPGDFTLVYFFGSHQFGLMRAKKKVLEPWECSRQEEFRKCFPSHLKKHNKSLVDELNVAIAEAETAFNTPAEFRVPAGMVPSDINPSLEPPPKEPSSEEEEEASEGASEEVSEEENEQDKNKDKKRRKKNKVQENDVHTPEEDENDDDDINKKSGKTNQDVVFEKEYSRDSASANDDASDQDSKSKKNKKNKRKRKSKEEKKKSKKRKTESKKEDDFLKENQREKTEIPVVEPKEDSMISNEEEDQAMKTKTKLSVGMDQSKIDNPEEMIHKEILDILDRGDLALLTTRAVRQQLEERLQIDMQPHKALIKRVLQEQVALILQQQEKQQGIVENTPENSEDITRQDGQKDIINKEQQQQQNLQEWTERITKYRKDLENYEETRNENGILDILNQLDKVDLNLEILASTNIGKVVTKLRKHKNSNIAQVAEKLRDSWKTLLSEQNRQKDTTTRLAELEQRLKDESTLNNTDLLLSTLQDLAQMTLTNEQLSPLNMVTSISSLRTNSNDQVAQAAEQLIADWEKKFPKCFSQVDEKMDHVKHKKIEEMKQNLATESHREPCIPSNIVKILGELSKMNITVSELKESNLGIMVGKLRKHCDSGVCIAAKSLRQEWKDRIVKNEM